MISEERMRPYGVSYISTDVLAYGVFVLVQYLYIHVHTVHVHTYSPCTRVDVLLCMSHSIKLCSTYRA